MFRRLSALIALISLGVQQISPLCSPVLALPIDSDSAFTFGVRSSTPVLSHKDPKETPLVTKSVNGGVSERFLAFDLARKTARLYSHDGELLQPNLSCQIFPWDQPADKLKAFLPYCWFSVQDGAFSFYGRLLGGGNAGSSGGGGGDGYGHIYNTPSGNAPEPTGIVFQNNSSVHTSGSSGSTYIPQTPAHAPTPARAAVAPAPPQPVIPILPASSVAEVLSPETPSPVLQSALRLLPSLEDRLLDMTTAPAPMSTPPVSHPHAAFYEAAGYDVSTGKGRTDFHAFAACLSEALPSCTDPLTPSIRTRDSSPPRLQDTPVQQLASGVAQILDAADEVLTQQASEARQALDARIRALQAQGLTPEEISDALGITDSDLPVLLGMGGVVEGIKNTLQLSAQGLKAVDQATGSGVSGTLKLFSNARDKGASQARKALRGYGAPQALAQDIVSAGGFALETVVTSGATKIAGKALTVSTGVVPKHLPAPPVTAPKPLVNASVKQKPIAYGGVTSPVQNSLAFPQSSSKNQPWTLRPGQEWKNKVYGTGQQTGTRLAGHGGAHPKTTSSRVAVEVKYSSVRSICKKVSY